MSTCNGDFIDVLNCCMDDLWTLLSNCMSVRTFVWTLHCVGASNKKKFSAWKYLGARCGASLRMGEVAPCREDGVGACREGAGAREGIMVLLPQHLLP